MPRSTHEWSEIRVVGEIWQPGFQCAQRYTIERHQLNNILQSAEKTHIASLRREDLEAWVREHTGDFSWVQDWSASFSMDGADKEIPWRLDGSAANYYDAMYGDELRYQEPAR